MKILNRYTQEILVEYECKNIKELVEYAVANDISLNNANLSNVNLRLANLSNANLWDADLRLVNLSNANLNNANLSNADLSNANLSNANLNNANLSNADLSYADLNNANLSNANLRLVNLSNANLSNANLNNANLSNANLWDANLNNADLNNVKLKNDLKVAKDCLIKCQFDLIKQKTVADSKFSVEDIQPFFNIYGSSILINPQYEDTLIKWLSSGGDFPKILPDEKMKDDK